MPGTFDKDDLIIELKAELATAKDDLAAERKRLMESKRKLVEARAALSRIEREVSMILS